METILYNTSSGQAISRVFPNGYFVDGVKPSLPSPIVELDVVRDPFPSVDLGSNIVTQSVTVTATEYIFGWTITPITSEPGEPTDPIPWSGEVNVGQAFLISKDAPMLEALPLDGSIYFSEDYPVLASLFPGIAGWSNGGQVIAGTPTAPGGGNAVKFNNAGTQLAIGYGSGQRLRIADTTTWNVIAGTPNPGATVNGIDYSPDDTLLATSLQDWPRLRVYNTSDWSLVSAAPTPNGPIVRVKFSPDGAYLAVAQINWPRVEVFNVADWTGASGFPIPGAPGNARDIDWSPDGELLAIAHEASPYLTVRSALSPTWATVPTTINLTSTARGVEFSPNGEFLAVVHDGAPYLTILETATWSVVAGTPIMPGPARKVSWDENGGYICIAHEEGNRFSLYRTTDWSLIPSDPNIQLPGIPTDVDFETNQNGLLAFAHAGNPFVTVIASAGNADEFILPNIQTLHPNFEWRIRGE